MHLEKGFLIEKGYENVLGPDTPKTNASVMEQRINQTEKV